MNRVNEMKARRRENDNQAEQSCLILSLHLGNIMRNLYQLSIFHKVTKQLIGLSFNFLNLLVVLELRRKSPTILKGKLCFYMLLS